MCTYFTGSPLYLRFSALLAVFPCLVWGEQCAYEGGVPQDWAGDANEDYYYDVQGPQRDRHYLEGAKPESTVQFKECEHGCCWQRSDVCCPMPSESKVAVIIAVSVSLVVIATMTIIAIVVGIRWRKRRNEKEQLQQPRQGHVQRAKYHQHPPTRALIVNEKSQRCGTMYRLPVDPPAYVLSPPKYEEIAGRGKQLAAAPVHAKGSTIPVHYDKDARLKRPS